MAQAFDFKMDTRLNAPEGFVKTQQLAEVQTPTANLYKADDVTSGTMAQALYGEKLAIYAPQNSCPNAPVVKDDFLLVQRLSDGYLSYCTKSSLKIDGGSTPKTHQVIFPRTFLYNEVDLKTSSPMPISMGTQICIEKWQEVRGTKYGILNNGRAIIADHIAALDERPTDFVAVAEKLIDTPYLWGGNSAFGIDCSGLVQLALGICGTSVLRDTDMQEASIGVAIEEEFSQIKLQRGDLVFWKGHVGIMQSSDMLLHANGHTMSVAREPIADAVDRIKYLYEEPTSVRRF